MSFLLTAFKGMNTTYIHILKELYLTCNTYSNSCVCLQFEKNWSWCEMCLDRPETLAGFYWTLQKHPWHMEHVFALQTLKICHKCTVSMTWNRNGACQSRNQACLVCCSAVVSLSLSFQSQCQAWLRIILSASTWGRSGRSKGKAAFPIGHAGPQGHRQVVKLSASHSYAALSLGPLASRQRERERERDRDRGRNEENLW